MKPIQTMIICLLMALPLTAFAGQGFYGIYSNMAAEEGEPSGFEMFFLPDGRPGRCSNSVLFQVAEGWPQYPELLDCCGCTANHVEFVSKKWGKFVGKVDNQTLTGEFIGPGKKVSLKRGNSIWQKEKSN